MSLNVKGKNTLGSERFLTTKRLSEINKVSLIREHSSPPNPTRVTLTPSPLRESYAIPTTTKVNIAIMPSLGPNPEGNPHQPMTNYPNRIKGHH